MIRRPPRSTLLLYSTLFRSFTPPTATDSCDPAPVVSEVSDVTTPGTCAGSYSRARTCHAKGTCGDNGAHRSQKNTVQDVTPPTMSAAAAKPTIASPAAPSFSPPP